MGNRSRASEFDATEYDTIRRSALIPLSRRYRGDIFYQLKRLQGKGYTDTYHGRHLSLEGNKYTQIFTNKQMFAVSIPLLLKSEDGNALKQFIAMYGVPEYLTFDNSAEQYKPGTEFMKHIKSLDKVSHYRA